MKRFYEIEFKMFPIRITKIPIGDTWKMIRKKVKEYVVIDTNSRQIKIKTDYMSAFSPDDTSTPKFSTLCCERFYLKTKQDRNMVIEAINSGQILASNSTKMMAEEIDIGDRTNGDDMVYQKCFPIDIDKIKIDDDVLCRNNSGKWMQGLVLKKAFEKMTLVLEDNSKYVMKPSLFARVASIK